MHIISYTDNTIRPSPLLQNSGGGTSFYFCRATLANPMLGFCCKINTFLNTCAITIFNTFFIIFRKSSHWRLSSVLQFSTCDADSVFQASTVPDRTCLFVSVARLSHGFPPPPPCWPESALQTRLMELVNGCKRRFGHTGTSKWSPSEIKSTKMNEQPFTSRGFHFAWWFDFCSRNPNKPQPLGQLSGMN